LNKSDFTERILEIIGEDKPYSWALRYDIAKSSIHNILKTGRPPGAEQLLKISHAANVSVDWLLTGHEFKTESLTDGNDDEIIEKENRILDIPIIYPPSTNDKLMQKLEYTALPFSKVWLNKLTENTDKLAIIFQYGDTMEPTIVEGDLLLVDTSTNKVTQDSIYAVNCENIYAARRLQKNIDGSIVIRCDNIRYGEQLVDSKKITGLEIIGKIIMNFHKF
jgi:phage repressor protein C with HTH and peptisase S24 domain